jgi:hypothetical protein
MDDTAERRQEARVILGDLARSIDRRLSLEVREVPGQDRVGVKLTQGRHTTQIELSIDAVLETREDAVARTELRLKLKRAADTMSFRPMPDHRMTVKPIAPPGGPGMRGGQGMRGGYQGGRGRR